jgi:hypothetical protein
MQKRGYSLAFLFAATFVLSSPWATSQQKTEAQDAPVPAYHAAPPAKGEKVPSILPKELLWGENSQYPYQTHAYELAAKIESVLYQQPCYCYCDRMGHKSLHTCFENTHGAECSICMKEMYYAYSEHKKGKTARQIRQGIIHGEWREVDLNSAAAMN